MNKQELASEIWKIADKLRSKINSDNYKDFILGFIFYKFLSDNIESFFISDGWEKDELKDLIDYNVEENLTEDEIQESKDNIKRSQDKNGYFISYKNLFSTWIKKGKDFSVSDITDALNAFERLVSNSHKKVFSGIFSSLQSLMRSLGGTVGEQTSLINDLLGNINSIPVGGKQGYDVLGYIYEYLISKFAANAGKKAGEFYTPHEVSVLMSEIIANHLKDRKTIDIYDPTSGSGSLLINIGKSVSKYLTNKDAIKYYAQELIPATYNLTRMNLVMRGIIVDNIFVRNGNTLEVDWPFFEDNDVEGTYKTLYLDAVVSNPPYSQAWEPKDALSDARFANYGIAPKTKADYAFLLHSLFHLKPDGIMTIVLPHGVLFRGGEEEKIRTNLIESNNIDAIIGLPANIFYGTSIPTIIMVLRQKRQNDDILFIDASKNFVKLGKNNQLQTSDIKRIVDAYINRQDIEKFSRKVSREEIRSNKYNLNIPRYVDSSPKSAPYDLYASILGGIPNHEINQFENVWKGLPSLKEQIFEVKNDRYSNAIEGDVEEIINNNRDVILFKNQIERQFDNFRDLLKERLLFDYLKINISKEKEYLTNEIFNLIKDIPLVDSYKAYQLFDDEWEIISNDLEVIQSDENWKKNLLDENSIKNSLFKTEANEIDKLNEYLENNKEAYKQICEEIDEEDKKTYQSLFKENGDIINSEVLKFVKKSLKNELEENSLNAQIVEIAKLLEEEKLISKQINQKNVLLKVKIEEKLKSLDDAEVKSILEIKWIEPLINSLKKLPDLLLEDLIIKVSKLISKYDGTLVELDEDIKEISVTISKMIDELVANEYDKKGLEEFKKILEGE
ncbi:type I restriction-modification system subunit M [Metamycoplasma spumans]|uniref:type I restriction-modification system subunit M n=1 Tax=Metamycoplasma spumans TaxID=92406 RepID=UPI0034DCF93B